MIAHPLTELEEVYPKKLIDSSEQIVKVTFIAKEPGFYKIIFSNQHSWMRAKILRYRYVVLRPVESGHLDDDIPEEDLLSLEAN